jgi:phosphoglycolate phosphatase
MIKLVIFDLDGVVINSIPQVVKFANNVLQHFGCDKLTKHQEKDAFTLTSKQFFAKYLKGVSNSKILFYAARTEPSYIRKVKLSRHMLQLLRYLNPRYKLAVGTNRTGETYMILRHFKILRYFNHVLTAADIKHPKPSPDLLITLMKRFNVKPKETIYIGDTSFDSRAAKSAHVASILYRTNYNRDARSTYKVKDLMEIKKILKRIDSQ